MNDEMGPAVAAAAAAAAGSPATTVLCKFLPGRRGIDAEIKDFSRPTEASVGQLQAYLAKKLRIPIVFLCLHVPGGEAFLPLPDLTLDEASLLFGNKEADGRRSITFSAATTTEVFQ